MQKKKERWKTISNRGCCMKNLRNMYLFLMEFRNWQTFPAIQNIEEEIMDFILENENREKTRYRWLWQTVTGIAASVIIVLGGFLILSATAKTFRRYI
jgi:hypothetical protein